MTGEAKPVARVAVTVMGDVQGVGFRWFVIRQAAALGLVGWVVNAADGSVRLEAEGEPEAVDRLVSLARQGPPGARVNGVTVERLAPRGSENRFEVRSGSHPGD